MKARKHDPLAGKRRVVGMKKVKSSTVSNPTPANDPTAPRASAPLVTVPFHGGELLAVAGEYPEEGERPIPLRPFCDRLGLDLSSQLAKLKGKAWACMVLIATQMPGDDQVRKAACLPLRAVPMWLATIEPNRVGADVRPALIAFQKEAADALYRHFRSRMAPVGPGLAKTSPASTGPTTEQVIELVGKMMEPIIETQRQTAQALAQLQAQVIALHRDHNAALDMAAIGGQCANARIKKVITRLAKEKARYLGGKKAEASFNRKFHLRAREACGGFQGPWDRLPRGLLGTAETCLANMEREVRADTLLAERHGYKPVQMNIEDARDRRPN